jgi:hypothetical protein
MSSVTYATYAAAVDNGADGEADDDAVRVREVEGLELGMLKALRGDLLRQVHESALLAEQYSIKEALFCMVCWLDTVKHTWPF